MGLRVREICYALGVIVAAGWRPSVVAQVLVLLLASEPSGCVEHGCNDDVRRGLNVQVVDASTGSDICGSQVVATDGSYIETLQETAWDAGCLYSGATERAGTYGLDVSAMGYQSAHRDGVVVTADACHVQTVTVVIALSH